VLIEARIVIVNNDLHVISARALASPQPEERQHRARDHTGRPPAPTWRSAGHHQRAGHRLDLPDRGTGPAHCLEPLQRQLPVSNPAGSFALGILGSNFIVRPRAVGAQAETQANIISSPRVITANQ